MSDDPEYEAVEGLGVELDGAVLRFSLDRPDKRNAVNDSIMVAMSDTLDRAAQDERVRAVVIEGAGDHFCGGADIVARNAPGGERPRVGSIQRRVPATAHRLIPTILNVQIPVVCRVQGWAAGIGMQFALAADFAVCAEDARLWEPFVARGFTPDSGATWLLPRAVGLVRARRLLLLGEPMTGLEAADAELVHQAVPTAELDGAVADLVDRLAGGPTVALGLTKRLLHDGQSNDLETHLHDEVLALELSSRSEDFREGLAAFRDKRDPQFRGR
ncbi:MAG: enoyl-CoA hydratase-related protein [Acidimicrobiales bacterium]|nr:enoyl-CoA hydratase-related protein [Acidimicrobiales bacterium]